MHIPLYLVREGFVSFLMMFVVVAMMREMVTWMMEVMVRTSAGRTNPGDQLSFGTPPVPGRETLPHIEVVVMELVLAVMEVVMR